MFRATNGTAIRPISSPQIGQRRPTDFSRRIFVPSPSCSFSVLLMPTTHSFTYSSTRSLCSILCSMLLLLAPVPTSLRCYKLASQQCLDRTMPPMLYPRQTIFTRAIGRLELSSLAPAPHRLLTRQTVIVRHIHVHHSAEGLLLSPACPVAVAVLFTQLAHTRRMNTSYQSRFPSLRESGVFHTYLLEILTSF